MSRTNHINLTDFSGRVYCFHEDKIVQFDQAFLDKACMQCPYFRSDSFGDGVECFFDDGSRRPEITFYDPADSEKWSKYSQVRLGLKTRVEVDGMLKGYSLLETPQELGLPARMVAPQERLELEQEFAELGDVSRKFASVSEPIQTEEEGLVEND